MNLINRVLSAVRDSETSTILVSTHTSETRDWTDQDIEALADALCSECEEPIRHVPDSRFLSCGCAEPPGWFIDCEEDDA